MATLGFQSALLKAVRGCGLGLADGGRRLEGDAEVDRGAVRDAALDTAGVVGAGREALSAVRRRGGDEGVVVDGPGHFASAEAGADLEALCGWDAEHCVRELGFQLVEARLAEPDGHVADHAGYCPADAVVVVAVVLDRLGHARRRLFVRAADRGELVYRGAVDCLQEFEVLRIRGRGGVGGGGRVEVLIAHG